MSKGTAILKKFTGKTSKPRTSLAEASPVSPSALPENEREPTTSAGYGLSLRGAFVYYDRATRCWKTCQGCLPWASETFSGTWPPSGMMRNGIAYPQRRLAPRTSVTGYGLWRSPGQGDAYKEALNQTKPYYGPGQLHLQQQIYNRMFPTPAAADGERGSETYCRGNPTLLGAARMWPTPRAQMGSLNQPSADKPHKGGGKPKRLEVEVGRRMWPTPTGRDYKDGMAKSCENVPVNSLLGRAVHRWPTPNTSDAWFSQITPEVAQKNIAEGGRGNSQLAARVIAGQTGGQLNPTWVEWLMGYPLGWTDLNVSATP